MSGAMSLHLVTALNENTFPGQQGRPWSLLHTFFVPGCQCFCSGKQCQQTRVCWGAVAERAILAPALVAKSCMRPTGLL
jgi:hypothetical protein